MLEKETSNKITSGIAVLITVVSGIAALVRPMQVQIDDLKAEVAALNVKVDFQKDEMRPGVIEKFASFAIQFTEIATQFKNLKDSTQKTENSFDEKLKALEEKIDLKMKLDRKGK